MKRFLLIVALLPISLWADSSSPVVDKGIEVWSLGSSFYPMERDPISHTLISKGCPAKKELCQAFKVLRDSKKRVTLKEKDLVGGKNPGAVICKKLVDGEILILRDSSKNENAFCKFRDGSLVSASALR